MSNKKEHNHNITVGVRIRPLNEKEINDKMPICFTSSFDEMYVQELNEKEEVVKNWSYDHVFGPEPNNGVIYNTMGRQVVDAALEGFNTVLFMYGQTASGKTFTLFGGENTKGIVQYAMEHIHQAVINSADTEYVIKVTFAELYNEELKDLLATSPNDNLKIVDDPHLGPLIQNITEANFTSPDEMKLLLDEGEQRRHFGVTNMNVHSSRSHVMVRLCIESRKVSGRPYHPLRTSWGRDRPNCVSTLNLVDLAGSERAAKSGTSGQSLKEGNFINKSLLTLGTVIANLSQGKLQHIPYRNSKLTRLLATALGGNAKTSIITCISPASGNTIESLSALRFASRAKRIINYFHKNEIMDAKTMISKLASQNAEIDMLRTQLEASRVLGYNNDSLETANSIKQRYLTSLRLIRWYRFLSANGYGILSSLFQQGHGVSPSVIKQWKINFIHILCGKNDPDDFLDEFIQLDQKYFMKNDVMLSKRFQLLINENELENLPTESEEQELLNKLIDEDGTESNLLNYGGIDPVDQNLIHELQQKLECSQFYAEDLISMSVELIEHYTMNIHYVKGKYDQLNQQYEELIEHNRNDQDTIQKYYKVIQSNQKKLSDYESKLHRQEEESRIQMESKMKRNEGLEVLMHDQAMVISQLNQIQKQKDIENDRLKALNESLSKELETSLTCRKLLEDESFRIQNEMCQQMDRLRTNMHEVLVKGGAEVKVMETHKSQLENETGQLRATVQRLQRQKEVSELEKSHLRTELTGLSQENKSLLDELSSLQHKNEREVRIAREMKLEVIRLTSALRVAEASHLKFQSQFHEEMAAKEEALLTSENELQRFKQASEERWKELQEKVDRLQLECGVYQEEKEDRGDFFERIEESVASDVLRLEKKLSVEKQRNEALALELDHFKQSQDRDNQQLQNKINELQSTIDSINQFIDDHEQSQPLDLILTPSVLMDGAGSGRSSMVGFSRQSSESNFITTTATDLLYQETITTTASCIPSPCRYVTEGSSWREEGSTYPSPYRSLNNSPRMMKLSNPSMYHSDTKSVLTFGDTMESPLDAMNPLNSPDFIESPFVLNSKHSHSIGGVAPSISWNSLTITDPAVLEVDRGLDHRDSIASSYTPQQTEQQLTEVLDNYYQKYSDTFQQIQYGLVMATSLMKYSLQDEKIIRNYLFNHHCINLEQSLENQYTIEDMKYQQNYLIENKGSMANTLDLLKKNEKILKKKIEELKNESNEWQKKYQQLFHQEKLLNTYKIRNEDLLEDMKLKYEKLKIEFLQFRHEHSECKLDLEKQQQNFDDLNESYLELRCKYDLMEQEFGVVLTERNQLLQQFIPAASNYLFMQPTTLSSPFQS